MQKTLSADLSTTRATTRALEVPGIGVVRGTRVMLMRRRRC